MTIRILILMYVVLGVAYSCIMSVKIMSTNLTNFAILLLAAILILFSTFIPFFKNTYIGKMMYYTVYYEDKRDKVERMLEGCVVGLIATLLIGPLGGMVDASRDRSRWITYRSNFNNIILLLAIFLNLHMLFNLKLENEIFQFWKFVICWLFHLYLDFSHKFNF